LFYGKNLNKKGKERRGEKKINSQKVLRSLSLLFRRFCRKVKLKETFFRVGNYYIHKAADNCEIIIKILLFFAGSIV
jgi:hypothetical protein